ncbi:MAG: hypothetical protein F6K17_11325 [Okeania sp. SIO3C4]|nr:hypothetical protein [Okeania sp. SIO3C4]
MVVLIPILFKVNNYEMHSQSAFICGQLLRKAEGRRQKAEGKKGLKGIKFFYN